MTILQAPLDQYIRNFLRVHNGNKKEKCHRRADEHQHQHQHLQLSFLQNPYHQQEIKHSFSYSNLLLVPTVWPGDHLIQL